MEYFISYYDYYQPEAYLPSSDTYIEKDSSINEEIDKMRHSATRSLLTRSDVLIVASVSCIYGLGSPEAYQDMLLSLETGQEIPREALLGRLVAMLYERNDIDFHRGAFRVRGDVVEVFPAYEEERGLRISFFGDQVEGLAVIDPLRGKTLDRLTQVHLFPNSHYVTGPERMEQAYLAIEAELTERLTFFHEHQKLIEAQRIGERTRFDLEMMKELGYCHGIENYSRHLTGRAPGQPPPTLLEYFPKDFLTVHRREPPGRAPDPGHVPGGPLPEADPGGLWLPPAFGPRQPPLELRGVRADGPPGDLRFGHPGGL